MDIERYSLDNLRGRIMVYSKFYYSDGFYIMEVFDMKIYYRSEPVGYSIKIHLINSFISNSEYLKKFLYLERRIDNIKKLGI